VKPSKNISQTQASFQEGDLLRLEIQIARRADKLWQMTGQGRGSDLIHWLQAENEVLGQYLGPEPRVEALAAADQ
jgi:Protein of unknown function (DUF2934)